MANSVAGVDEHEDAGYRAWYLYLGQKIHVSTCQKMLIDTSSNL